MRSITCHSAIGVWVIAVVLVGLFPRVSSATSWTSEDVGSVGLAGSAVESGGVWTIQGAGSDIWSNEDSFHFVHQTYGYDQGFLMAHIRDLQNTNPYAKAGVMLRNSTAANAGTVLLDVKPNGELEFMERPGDNSGMSYLGGLYMGTDVWLRLDWQNNQVTASASSGDGNWTVVGTSSFSIPPMFEVGLAVTSHDPGVLNVVHADSLTLLIPRWNMTSVGSTGLPGSVAWYAQTLCCKTEVTVEGAGSDIWGQADSFQFVYNQTTSPDFYMQVSRLDDTSPFAKAGIVFRSSLAPNAATVILDMKPNGEVEFMARACDGCDMSYIAGATPGMGTYLKLSRSGAQINGLTAPAPGGPWTTIGSVTITAMPANAYFGLAVTSHDTTQVTTAVFDLN